MNTRAAAIALAATTALALPCAASAEFDNRPFWRKTVDRLVPIEDRDWDIHVPRHARDHDSERRTLTRRDVERQSRRDHSDISLPWSAGDEGEIACTIYRVAFVLRHGANKPSSLQLRRGCDLWAADMHYHTRRR